MTERSSRGSWIDGISAACGIRLENLREAHRVTEQRLRDATDALRSSLERRIGSSSDDQLDVLVHGSMARREMSRKSDFDYLILSHGMGEDPSLIQEIRAAADDAREEIGAPKPGSTNIFGDLVSATDLVHRIGLEQDTNRSLTNRVLVLVESEALLHPAKFAEFRRTLLWRYLFDYVGRHNPGPIKRGVPWFLLNDVVRYWRTVAVDYQAKRWVELKGQKWGTRYIKLLSSRKWTFAGTVVSLFMARIERAEVRPEFLLRQFTMTPLARLAQLHGYLPDGSGRDALCSILVLADEFVGQFGDESFRKAVNQVTHPSEAETGSVFERAKIQTIELQQALERLFFSEETLINRPDLEGEGDDPISLADLSRHYLVF